MHPSDPLSAVLQHLPITADVFHAGALCGLTSYDADALHGHLHLVRSGPVRVLGLSGGDFLIDRPSLLFLPRPEFHRLLVDDRSMAQVVCARVQFGAGGTHALNDSLPACLLIELQQAPALTQVLDVLYAEGFADHPGRQFAMDRLCELVMLITLRHGVDHGLVRGGVLAAIADARLSKAVVAFHGAPQQAWTLQTLADKAGMSRGRFATHFKAVTTQTPGDYISAWRVALAARLLKAGRPLKVVADEVGYGSASALTRAFARHSGQSAGRWARSQRG